MLAVAAAVTLVLGGVGLGHLLIPRTQLVVQPAQPGPYEAIKVDRVLPGLVVAKAGVVPHTWGVELKMEGSGFGKGQTYRAIVVGRDGSRTPAGEFLGTEDQTLKCNLQAALLRRDASGVVIMDASGLPVLTAGLTLTS